MTKSQLPQELLRIGRAWPPDVLRPKLQYGNFLVALSKSKEHEKHITPALIRSQQRLLENRLKEKYALSDKMLYPASYPEKYARLVGQLEDVAESSAEEGEKPTGFLGRIFGR
ncbi:hypothetical protein FRC19_010684 [Serendipita sp. 401]|nr:hypothetical protein FRC19_010684 [Serendipita sp. 401]